MFIRLAQAPLHDGSHGRFEGFERHGPMDTQDRDGGRKLTDSVEAPPPILISREVEGHRPQVAKGIWERDFLDADAFGGRPQQHHCCERHRGSITAKAAVDLQIHPLVVRSDDASPLQVEDLEHVFSHTNQGRAWEGGRFGPEPTVSEVLGKQPVTGAEQRGRKGRLAVMRRGKEEHGPAPDLDCRRVQGDAPMVESAKGHRDPPQASLPEHCVPTLGHDDACSLRLDVEPSEILEPHPETVPTLVDPREVTLATPPFQQRPVGVILRFHGPLFDPKCRSLRGPEESEIEGRVHGEPAAATRSDPGAMRHDGYETTGRGPSNESRSGPA